MGTFKKKKLIILMSIANLASGCTTTGTTVCTTAGSCCATFTKVTAVADTTTAPVICIPVGSKIATALPFQLLALSPLLCSPTVPQDTQPLTALLPPPVPPPSPSPLSPPPPPST